MLSYTYEYYTNQTSEVLHIYGFEPATGSGYPVYIHSGGMGDKFDNDTPEMRMAQEMAERGFVAAIIENPSREFAGFACADEEDSLVNISRRIYGYTGPGDTQSTALATMCAREKADCSAGIAIHGLSYGGLLAALAARNAVGVTAELRYARVHGPQPVMRRHSVHGA